ncbi:hypothetical protein Esti_005443 [Eimeria stiedai]
MLPIVILLRCLRLHVAEHGGRLGLDQCKFPQKKLCHETLGIFALLFCREDDDKPSTGFSVPMESLSRFSTSVGSPANESGPADTFEWTRSAFSEGMLLADDEAGLMKLECENELAATGTTAESVCADTPELDHATLRAASLLTRAAKRIEVYQAEQRRLRLQQWRFPPEEEVRSAPQNPSTTCASTPSNHGKPWLAPSDLVSSRGAAASNASAAASSHRAARLSPQWQSYRAEGVALREHFAASETFFQRHPRQPAEPVESASLSCVRKERDLTARLSVRFCEPEATTATSSRDSNSRQALLQPEDEFARRLQVVQRRHLRKLQRQQQQQQQQQEQQQQQRQEVAEVESRRAGQVARAGSDSRDSSESRAFTQHGLRRKTAALFKDAVRRGLLSGPTAEKVKEEIESGLYEAPSKKAMEEAELRECTFKPQINPHVSLRRRDKVPWWERLHAEAQRILESQEGGNTVGKLHASKTSDRGGKRVASAAELDPPYSVNLSSRRGVAAEGGSRAAASGPGCSSLLFSLQLQPSHGSRLVPKKQSCTDTSGCRQPNQGRHTSSSSETALTGRALLQRYLGGEAPQWLRLAREQQSHVN